MPLVPKYTPDNWKRKIRAILTNIYIDDCLVMADSKEKLIDGVTYVASTLDGLGLTINWEKSELQPS